MSLFRVCLVAEAGLAAMIVLVTIAQGVLCAPSAEPPAAGRPEDFSGIVGTYEIETWARPTEVAVLQPLTLTIKITETSKASPPSAPQRSDLHLFPPSLSRDFYVEALPDMAQPDAHAWEFAYRLKPKTAAVQRIPALKLTYYDPRYSKYQVAYSRPIPLKIKPLALAQTTPQEKNMRLPEHVYQLETGPAVLRREGSSPEWSPSLLAALFLVPPAACALWYIVWMRLRPDEVRRARLQRSRAARDTLRQLHALRPASGVLAAALVTEYLRRRLNLVVVEPTPTEAWTSLRRARVSPLVASKVCEFLHACDAASFAPEAQRDGQNLAAQAEGIIHAVETEPCLSRHY